LPKLSQGLPKSDRTKFPERNLFQQTLESEREFLDPVFFKERVWCNITPNPLVSLQIKH